MGKFRLTKGLQIHMHGREYVIEGILSNGDIRIRDVILDTYQAFSQAFLIQELFNGRLALAAALSKRVNKPIEMDFSETKTEWKQQAVQKDNFLQKIIEPLGENFSVENLKALIKVTAEKEVMTIPSLASVYRWKKAFDSAEGDIRGLVPSHCSKGNRQHRMPDEVYEIMQEVVEEKYLQSFRPRASVIYELLVNRIDEKNSMRALEDKLPIPTKMTFYRYINNIDDYEKAEKRYGKRLADYLYNPVQRSPKPTRPLEWVEIDHNKMDIIVVDEFGVPIGRPWMTVAIDKYTRVIVGFYISFEPPSYVSIMHCLKNAISPKGYVRRHYPIVENDWNVYGIPETIVVDNGKEFYSRSLEDARLQLGINIQYAPPRLAWYKGYVERFFGTLATNLLENLPGKTFSNALKKFDYKPGKDAIVKYDTLKVVVHKWVVDIYHQRFHRGLKAVPIKVWNQAIADFPPALPTSVKDLSILVGKVEHRAIQRSGVEIFRLMYSSTELARLRKQYRNGEKAKIKYDPADISCIYVFDKAHCEYIQVPCIEQEYTRNLSKWQHDTLLRIVRQREKEVDVKRLAYYRRQIDDLVQIQAGSKKKAAPQQSQRWEEANQRPFSEAPVEHQGAMPDNLSTEVYEDKETLKDSDIVQRGIRNNPMQVVTEEIDLSGFDSDYSLPSKKEA